MKRYTLKCKRCEQIIGYMSLMVDSIDDIYVISQTVSITGKEEVAFPIYCPACEVEEAENEQTTN